MIERLYLILVPGVVLPTILSEYWLTKPENRVFSLRIKSLSDVEALFNLGKTKMLKKEFSCIPH